MSSISPLSLNSGQSASYASVNLADSIARQQQSIRRLSSGSKITNASDDAGGVAVAARLGAASKRMGAVTSNIANAQSFLQNQDSVLKSMSKMLERMSELQAMFADQTKNSTDRSNYTTEFDSLADSLQEISTNSRFNGNSLISGATGLNITVSETLSGNYQLANIGGILNQDFSELSIGGDGTKSSVIGTNSNFDELTSIAYAHGTDNIGDSFSVNGVSFAIMESDRMTDILDRINASLDVTASVEPTSDPAAWWAHRLKFESNRSGPTAVSVTVTSSDNIWNAHFGLGSLTTTNGSYSSTQATDALNEAISKMSSARAANGADQSLLHFYYELGQSTITNYGEAISKLSDVDVAEESTKLAKYNTLIQAGLTMLAQANVTADYALRLLR